MAENSFSESRQLPRTFKELFEGRRARLEEMIDSNHGLLSLLRDKNLLTLRQFECCMSACKDGLTAGTMKMLDILLRCSDDKVTDFLGALTESKQEHIINDILLKPPKSLNIVHGSSSTSSACPSVDARTLSNATDSQTEYACTFPGTQNHGTISNTHSSLVPVEHPSRHTSESHPWYHSQCEIYAESCGIAFKGAKVSPVDLIKMYLNKNMEISNLTYDINKLQKHVIDLVVAASNSKEEIRNLNQQLSTACDTHSEHVARLQRQLRAKTDKLEQVINEKAMAENRIVELQKQVTELYEILKRSFKKKIYVRERASMDKSSTLALPSIGHESSNARPADFLSTLSIEELEMYDQDINWVLPYEILEHILMKTVQLQIGNDKPMTECEHNLTTLLSVCDRWKYVLTSRRYIRHRIRHSMCVVAGSVFRKNMEFVRTFVEPDYGLLDELKVREVLTPEEFSEISDQVSTIERVDKLLDIMTSKVDEQYGMFVTVLRHVGQHHVANVLRTGGCCTNDFDDQPLRREFGDDRPLSKSFLSFIDLNEPMFCELLDPSRTFLEKLHTVGCINQRQKESVELCLNAPSKVLLLMAILKRRSVADCNNFINCLKDTGQAELASIFRSEGVIVPVTTEICTNVFRKSTSLSYEKFQSAYSQSTLNQRLGSDGKLICLKYNKRWIHSYFRCNSIQALHQIDFLYATGSLFDMLRDVYRLVADFHTFVKNKMSLTMNVKVYINTVRHFHVKMGLLGALYKLTPHDYIHTFDFVWNSQQFELHNWPANVLHHILQKSAVLQCAEFAKVSAEPYSVVYLALGSVCAGWRKELRLRRGFLRRLLRAYRQPKIVHSFRASGRVIAVAELSNRIFVIPSGSHSVLVFGKNYRLLTDISLSRTATPNDIVACNVSNRLFVADKRGDCIWSVSARPTQQTTKCVRRNWFLTRKFTDAKRPLSLSVRNGRLLVTSTCSSDLLLLGRHPNDISVTIHLHNMTPKHAAETPAGTFVICHAVLGGYELCEADVDGTILRCYDCNASVKRLPSSALKCSPSRVALNPDGRVYAVDRRNGRVLQLDDELKLRRVVLDDDDVQNVNYISYVERTGHFFVVDHSDVIRVYQSPNSTNFVRRYFPYYFSYGVQLSRKRLGFVSMQKMIRFRVKRPRMSAVTDMC